MPLQIKRDLKLAFNSRKKIFTENLLRTQP
jgi:hypothetical protein